MNANQMNTGGQDYVSIAPNDVLITNSLVIQASMAVESSQLDAGLFFDLSSLIEAAILHDHLLFLYSPLNDYYASLHLRQLLVEEGILRQYTPSINVKKLKDEIVHVFAKDNPDLFPFGGVGGQESIKSELENNELLPYIYGESPDDTFNPLASHPFDVIHVAEEVSRFPNDHLEYRDLNDPQESLKAYFAGLLGQWDITAWRRPNPRPALAFLLRTLVYLTISDQFGLSLYPDLLRIPIILQITNDLHRSLTQEAYSMIAEGFSTNIEDLKRANAPFKITIPPLTALVLDKSTSPKDIGPVLMDLRAQFSGLRTTYRHYENTIRSAKTLKEIQRARRELIQVNSRLAKAYEIQDNRQIQETASYLEKAVKVGTNPLSPTSYSADLVLKPIGWIQEWWIKRRAIHLFDMKKKLDHLQEYGRLTQKVFGVDLESGFAVYEQYHKEMKKLYFGEA
jgi:hypothetical protein